MTVSGHRNGHFHHKNTTAWPKKAKFYNLVRTIHKAIKPDYVKVNDERDTFMSKLEGLVLDYRPWNHVEPSMFLSIVRGSLTGLKSYFSLHGGVSTSTICNLLYRCIPVTKRTLQISWRGYGPSSWPKLIRFRLKKRTETHRTCTCKAYNLYEIDATYRNNLNNITTLAPIHPAYVLLNKICMLNINKNLPWNCLIDHYQCQSQWPNRLICHFFLEEHDNISWITNITFYYQADDWTLTLALMYEVSCENFLQNHRLTVHGHGYLGHLYFLLDMNVRELFQHDVHLQSFSC